MKTLREWVLEFYSKYDLKMMLKDEYYFIEMRGLTYYYQIKPLWETYNEEIWEWLNSEADLRGYISSMDFITTFSGYKTIKSDCEFQKIVLWAYVQSIARDEIEGLK